MTKEDLEQIRQLFREENEPLKQGQAKLEEGQAHLQTAIEAVKAGLDDVRDRMATEASVMDQNAKLDRITRNHERRIEALEEQAGLKNPYKKSLSSTLCKWLEK